MMIPYKHREFPLLSVVGFLVLGIIYGQRVPTKVLYNAVTPIANIQDAATIASGIEYAQVFYIHETDGKLLVGMKGIVNSYDLKTLASQNTEATLDLVDPIRQLPCAFSGSQPERCFNYVNVIQPHDDDGHWYYCGTSGINPTCWKCAAYTCTNNEETNAGSTTRFPAQGLVTSLRGTDQPFIIVYGAPDKVFGAAADLDVPEQPSTAPTSDSKHAILRANIWPDGTFSTDPEDSDDESGQMTDMGVTDTIETDKTNKKQVEGILTDFVGEPIDKGDHIYFFYREVAFEYKHIDRIFYSRVARVCKDDAGGPEGASAFDGKFTTFQKARLNCAVTGDDRLIPVNYDYIQDIYQSPKDDDIIYAVFTDTPIDDRANSAICVYNMEEIVAVFENSDFWGQMGTNLLWCESGDANCDAEPSTRPGTCAAAQPDTSYDFIAGYPLMSQLLPSKQLYTGSPGAWDRDSDSPLMLLDGIYITQLVVDEDAAGSPYDVFFLGSKDGKVYKAYVFGAGTADIQTRIIQEINLGTGDKEVLTMAIHKDASNVEFVYVGTVSSLHAIPVACCNAFTTEIDCILSQSPYCSWDTDTCEADKTGTRCLMNDVYSCGDWPEAECFSAKTGEIAPPTKPASECADCCAAESCALNAVPSCNPLDCLPDYVRVTMSLSESESSEVVLNSFVRAPQESVWGTTEFECDCGCPPDAVHEITEQSTDNDGKEYLLGSYTFDMSTCNSAVDIKLTFMANGQPLEKTITVGVDASALISDDGQLTTIRETDQQLSAYHYQACWWRMNKSTSRKAESVYCYNCPDG